MRPELSTQIHPAIWKRPLLTAQSPGRCRQDRHERRSVERDRQRERQRARDRVMQGGAGLEGERADGRTRLPYAHCRDESQKR